MAREITWRDLEPWMQARIGAAVLGYKAQKAFVKAQEDGAIQPGRTIGMDGGSGGKGGRKSDPTGAAVLRLEKIRLRNRAAIEDIRAVDEAFNEILKDVHSLAMRKRITQALFDSFDPRQHNVAKRYELLVSERTFWRMRSRFALLVAENLGLL